MIQTKVARVVSPTELILAAGSTEGVEEGMEFVIFSLSDPVFDPETKEELGRIEIVKARVVAAHVQERMTVARTKSRVVSSFLAATLADAISASHTVQERMNVDKVEGFTSDSVVRVGDTARSVTKPVPVTKPELVLN